MITRGQAVAAAIQVYESMGLSRADCREIDAQLTLKRWIVRFLIPVPPNTVINPSSYCVIVHAETGEAEWYNRL